MNANLLGTYNYSEELNTNVSFKDEKELVGLVCDFAVSLKAKYDELKGKPLVVENVTNEFNRNSYTFNVTQNNKVVSTVRVFVK